jgi:WD40 repeat protein
MPSEPKYKLAKELSRKEIVFSIARLPNSQKLFLGGSDGNVYALDVSVEKPEAVTMAGHAGYVTGMAMGAAETLVTGSSDGQLIWWNAATREQIRTNNVHEKWVRAVKTSPDGKLIASVGDDMVCRIWNTENGALKHELRGHEPLTPQNLRSMLYTCAFSADGMLLATADRVGHIVVWNVADGKPVGGIETPLLYTRDDKQRLHSIGGVRSVAFSPDGNHLAAGGVGQIGNIDGLGAKSRVEIHDWRKKERLAELTYEKQGLIEYLHYHPGGNWLLIAGGGGKGIFIFVDPKDRKTLADENVPMYVHDVAADEDYKHVYLGGHNKVAVYADSSLVQK